jgi:hypothetical protein
MLQRWLNHYLLDLRCNFGAGVHLMENPRVVCLCCSYGSNSILANMDELGNLPVAAGR